MFTNEDIYYSQWKSTRTLNQLKKPIPPIGIDNRSLPHIDSDKANTFGHPLQTIFQPFLSSMEKAKT